MINRQRLTTQAHRVEAAIAFVLLLIPPGCTTNPSGDAEQRAAASRGSMVDPGHGQLLYETACVGCHTEQAHWRDRRLVRDWPGLIEQVTRWQETTKQNWRADDIEDVATYLNDTFYRLPCPTRVCDRRDIKTGGSFRDLAR